MDQIERNLQQIADKLTMAWRGNQCLTCPLAELAALANATLVFYKERDKFTQHWSDDWRREQGGK